MFRDIRVCTNRLKAAQSNHVQSVREKEDEKERKKKLERQLKQAQSKLRKFQAKDDSVVELRRQINDLLSNKQLNQRAESRFNIKPLSFACILAHTLVIVYLCVERKR